MREFFFTGWLDNVALGQAVNLFGWLVRNLLNVGMTALTFDLGMHAFVEDIFIDVHQPEVTLFIHSAEAGILVAQQAVADVCRIDNRGCAKGEKQQSRTRKKDGLKAYF